MQCGGHFGADWGRAYTGGEFFCPARPVRGFGTEAAQGGAVVNVTSIAELGWCSNPDRARGVAARQGFPDPAAIVTEFGIPNGAGYKVSKEILLVWTLMAAHKEQFKSRGIRVNAVSRGPVEMPILTRFSVVLGDARVDSDIARVGRAGTAADIALVVLVLCSDAARWMNGGEYCGGWRT